MPQDGELGKNHGKRDKQTAEYTAFTNLVDRVLSVPRAEIQRRESEYRAQVDANPRRRGPKRGSHRPKKNGTASRGPA
jgi:hypothetical protein